MAMVKYLYPVALVIISILIVAVENHFYELQPTINYFGFAAYGAITIIMIVMFVAIQQFTTSREIYIYLVAGFTFVYISLLMNTLDKIYVMPGTMIEIAEDLFQLVGFGFVTVGIIKWIKYDEKVKRRLVELASMDELTGIMNRRIFDIEFQREFINTRRYGRELSLIMIDIDHFKQINDTYGHFFGDLVLKMFTMEVGTILRAGDYFGRWGGDEFCVLLPQTSAEDAMVVAEKIRTTVQGISIKTERGELKTTVSQGVAGYRPEYTKASEMLEIAHRAHYTAKQTGRNRVVRGE
jgi:diguanylate cyclase (GGDEF)-like protein